MVEAEGEGGAHISYKSTNFLLILVKGFVTLFARLNTIINESTMTMTRTILMAKVSVAVVCIWQKDIRPFTVRESLGLFVLHTNTNSQRTRMEYV